MGVLDNLDFAEIFATFIYVLIGMGLFGMCWLLIEWLTPFSLRREIEVEKNLAIAILMGAMFIAISIIISAVIRS